MGLLRFSDGIEIDTSMPLCILKLEDGLYVCGDGFLMPVETVEKGKQIIRQLSGGEK